MTDCSDALGPPSDPPSGPTRPASHRQPRGLGLSLAPVIVQSEMASASDSAGASTCPCR